MSDVTLTPIDLSDATALSGNRFRKQILKFGSINYKGRKITFDRPFLQKVVRAFNDGAYDQVPFVLADASNGHNMDPEKFRGSVVGMELTDDGLDAIIEATEGGAKVIQENPRLGVSARIVADLTKSDGRKFPLAIQHVLATMDPRVTGMRPWQAVTDLSNDDEDTLEVVDLSAHPYIKENSVPRIAKKTASKTPVPAKAKRPADRRPKKTAAPAGDGNVDLSNLSDEEFQALLDLAATDQPVEDDEESEDEDEDLDEDETDEEDDESEDDEESDEDEEDDEEDDDEEEAPAAPVANLSKKTSKRDQNVIDLAHQVLKRDRARLSAREWKADKREYAAAGVPPFLLDLATPIMLADEEDLATFDLSHEVKGKTRKVTLGTRDIVKKMLDGMKGMVDLSEDLGHQITGVAANDPDAGLLKAWESEYGKA